MQRLDVADVVEQILPVVGSALAAALWRGAIAFAPGFRSLRSSRVAEIANEQLDNVINELARFCFANVGQLLKLDLPRLAAVPAIRLLGVGMDTGDDDLLPLAEKFDLLWLCSRPRVRGD